MTAPAGRTLVLVEHDGRSLHSSTARTLTAAVMLGAPVDLLLAGDDIRAVAAAAAKLEGVGRVLLADDPQFGDGRAEPCARLVIHLAPEYGALVAAEQGIGPEVLPRVAAILDAPFVSGVRRILAPERFQRDRYGGDIVETVVASGPLLVVTIRAAAFSRSAGKSGHPAEIVVSPIPPSGPSGSVVVEDRPASVDRPDLATARVVIAGGRGFRSEAEFRRLIEPIAAKLGAAVGVSRGAVDTAGGDPDLLIGQSGRSIAPDLYIACGISGASQHLAGVRDARIVVAINRDPDAPIMKTADYVLVADVDDALSELAGLL